jgi:hypothetical protein
MIFHWIDLFGDFMVKNGNPIPLDEKIKRFYLLMYNLNTSTIPIHKAIPQYLAEHTVYVYIFL